MIAHLPGPLATQRRIRWIVGSALAAVVVAVVAVLAFEPGGERPTAGPAASTLPAGNSDLRPAAGTKGPVGAGAGGAPGGAPGAPAATGTAPAAGSGGGYHTTRTLCQVADLSALRQVTPTVRVLDQDTSENSGPVTTMKCNALLRGDGTSGNVALRVTVFRNGTAAQLYGQLRSLAERQNVLTELPGVTTHAYSYFDQDTASRHVVGYDGNLYVDVSWANLKGQLPAVTERLVTVCRATMAALR
jgi:hypothetical protein